MSSPVLDISETYSSFSSEAPTRAVTPLPEDSFDEESDVEIITQEQLPKRKRDRSVDLITKKIKHVETETEQLRRNAFDLSLAIADEQAKLAKMQREEEEKNGLHIDIHRYHWMSQDQEPLEKKNASAWHDLIWDVFNEFSYRQGGSVSPHLISFCYNKHAAAYNRCPQMKKFTLHAMVRSKAWRFEDEEVCFEEIVEY